MKAKLVETGGILCVRVPASIFGTPMGATAKYDVSLDGKAIVATFAFQGARGLVAFGLAASPAGVVAQTSHFGLNIDPEAVRLGWKAGRDVIVTTGEERLVFT